jgi:hypothetical protein
VHSVTLPQTTLHRQEAAPPPQWSIYNALSADELIALRAAGVSIRGRYVMSRTCPECGQPGEVGVTETTLADGIAFIARDGWTCRACREKATAHWVASPKPQAASRGAAPTGDVGKNPRRRSASAARAKSKRTQLAEAHREFAAAVADGDVARADALYHHIIHLGGRVQWPAAFGQEVAL